MVTSEANNLADATLLMAQAAEGDRAAADRLLSRVNEQLLRAAHLAIRGERVPKPES